jgi:hypothetical protein
MARFGQTNWVQDDRLRTRFAALGSSLTKTTRILTGRREVGVKMMTTMQTKLDVPGFSDGQTITIHRDKFRNIGDPITLVQIMGLTYHELSHIMMTPRNQHPLRAAVVSERLGYAFNALEDQRIETQFVATYRSAAKYFTEMVVEFLVGNQDTWELAHMLTHGRRFLPLEIREQFKNRFILDDVDTKRLEEIINQYRLLNISTQYMSGSEVTEVMKLIREYDQLSKKAQTMAGKDAPNPMGADENGTQGCGSQSDGKPDENAGRTAARKAQEQTEEQDEVEEDGEDGSGFWDDVPDDEEDDETEEDEDDDEGGSASGAASEDDEDEEDDEESSSGGSDASDESEGSASDDDDDEAGDENGEGSSSDSDPSSSSEDDDEVDSDEGGDGVGGGDNDVLDDDEMQNLLDDITNALMSSEQVQGDLRQMHSAINDPDAFDLDDNLAAHTKQPAPSSLVSASENVVRELRKLYAEVEPGWKYGSDTGRLNVQRAMNSDDFDDVFDEWDEGREHDAGVEVVIALDTSYSMHGVEAQAASEALWVLKRAFDSVEATVSAMGFDSVTTALFKRHDKVPRSEVTYFDAEGGDTCPAQALRNARRILTQSEKPNKLFVIITDGQWSPTNFEQNGRVENLSALIKTIPATTMFLGIGRYGLNKYSSEFDIAQFVSHSNEVAPIIKFAVSHMLKNVIRKVR